MKKFLREFKEFALRGSVMDLAVGVIIGAAFQSIVNSLVNDVMSPLIGLIAKTDLSDLKFDIFGVSIKYGSFLTAIINFIIMAFIIFLLVKGINAISNFGKKNKEEEPTVKICPYCMTEIDIKATRCPHCTSQLEEEEVLEDTTDEKLS